MHFCVWNHYIHVNAISVLLASTIWLVPVSQCRIQIWSGICGFRTSDWPNFYRSGCIGDGVNMQPKTYRNAFGCMNIHFGSSGSHPDILTWWRPNISNIIHINPMSVSTSLPKITVGILLCFFILSLLINTITFVKWSIQNIFNLPLIV